MPQALRQTSLSASPHNHFGQRNAEFPKNPCQQLKFAWEVMRKDRLGVIPGKDVESGLFERVEHANGLNSGTPVRQAAEGIPSRANLSHQT